MARDSKGITQFYLPPTHEPYLPLLPSRSASPPFGWYSLRLPTEGWPDWVDLGEWLYIEIDWFYNNPQQSSKKFASGTQVRNIRHELHYVTVLVNRIVNSAMHHTEASFGLHWMISGTLLVLRTSTPTLYNWDWISNSVWTTNHSS